MVGCCEWCVKSGVLSEADLIWVGLWVARKRRTAVRFY